MLVNIFLDIDVKSRIFLSTHQSSYINGELIITLVEQSLVFSIHKYSSKTNFPPNCKSTRQFNSHYTMINQYFGVTKPLIPVHYVTWHKVSSTAWHFLYCVYVCRDLCIGTTPTPPTYLLYPDYYMFTVYVTNFTTCIILDKQLHIFALYSKYSPYC